MADVDRAPGAASRKLGISEQTVKYHAASRIEAATIGVRKGLTFL
jgi:hypothetical protein